MGEAKWYVVHTYSGYENKVKVDIEKTIENNKKLAEQIGAPESRVHDLRHTFAVLSLQNGIMPPTINFIEKDPEIPDWNFCANKAVRHDIRYAINNAFGFGGHNVSILFKKFEA